MPNMGAIVVLNTEIIVVLREFEPLDAKVITEGGEILVEEAEQFARELSARRPGI